ncbi:MAG TPA: transglycosylase SLT domain-containing protein [Burkholderiaceae bacterium]|nr:transglycosylase SLT domain-containing protein [Burkholderiaceae bacterium]
MSTPTNVLLPQVSPLPHGLRVFAQDVASGMARTARFVVTFTGCASLVTVAVAVGDPRLRDGAAQQLESIAAALVAKEATADQASLMPAGAALPTTGASKNQVEPTQRHVISYLARRYKVADGAIRPVVAAAYESGRELGLDPLLILAVTAIESSMNPFAESVVGAQGLMQVMTRVHADKFEPHGGEDAALDPIANIKVGSAILSDLIRRGGSVERGLQLYVGAGNMVDDGGYGARVLAEHGRLRLAASGKVDLAIANAMRAAGADAKPVSQTLPVSLGPVTTKRS